MTDVAVTHAAEPPATGYASGGFSPERIFIWIALIAALGFWLPYTFIVDHAILQAMF
jgi:hypothetical protein